MKYLAIVVAVALLVSNALADIRGKVVGPDGKAAKNSTIYFFEYPGEDSPAPTTRRDPTTMQADDAGNFHIAGKKNTGAIMASAPGLGIGFIGNIRPDIDTEIRLTQSTDVTLTFIAPDKNPAAEISVSLQNLNEMIAGDRTYAWIPPGYNSPFSATTDAKGVCTIRGLPQGAQAYFRINDDRFAGFGYGHQVSLDTAPKTQADPINLLPASSISGKVTYASSGAPAAGISVQAQPNDWGSAASVATSNDGSYTIKQLGTGQFTVSLDLRPDLAKSWTAKAVENIGLSGGSDKKGIDLTLIPGVTLTGSVIAGDTGKGIPGVQIGIYGPAHPRNNGSVQTVTTDADGHFTAHVPPGDQLVYIMSDIPADGYGRPSPDNRNVTIADGATGSVEFRLPRMLMSPVKGTVVDPDGNPVAGARVEVSSEESPMFLNTPTLSAADGTFQTIPMIRTGKLEIHARFKDLATPKAIVINAGSTEKVVIQLQKNALASIVGRLVDPQGQPIKGAHVNLDIIARRYSTGGEIGVTDANGGYKADDLWPDVNYLVLVNFDGYGEAESARLHLQPGVNTLPNLVIYKLDSAIAGVLLNANEKPVVGIQIQVNGSHTGWNSATTDASGKFTTSVVTGDRLTLSYQTGRGYTRVVVKAGDQNITLHTSAPRIHPPPAPVVTAPAASASNETPAAPVPSAFNPADATTWTGWLIAAVLLVVGGAITVIANAIAAMMKTKATQP